MVLAWASLILSQDSRRSCKCYCNGLSVGRPTGHGGVQGLGEGGHAALADNAEAPRLPGLAHCGGGERRQEEEQDQPPAPYLHHGQDPQRLLQQAE